MTALVYTQYAYDQSPKFLTLLVATAAPYLSCIPPMSLASWLSLEMACIYEGTWSRLTIVPMRTLGHSEWGN